MANLIVNKNFNENSCSTFSIGCQSRHSWQFDIDMSLKFRSITLEEALDFPLIYFKDQITCTMQETSHQTRLSEMKDPDHSNKIRNYYSFKTEQLLHLLLNQVPYEINRCIKNVNFIWIYAYTEKNQPLKSIPRVN